MKRFRAYAIRRDRKYAGTFEALNNEEAVQKLKAQGYEGIVINELRSRGPVVGAACIVILSFVTLFFWASVSNKHRLNAENRAGSGVSHRHKKNPLEVLGKLAELKSGNYLIATSEDVFAKAFMYKNAHDDKLDQMLARSEVGKTQQYGGGQKVYVRAWFDTEHVMRIEFKESEVTAWVEEGAVLD